jgi:hypothetical protein
MPRDFLEELEISTPSSGKARDFLQELGINPKNENQILGENIQTRHPRTAKLLGKLANTSIGRGIESAGQVVKPANEFMENSGIPEFSGGALSGAMNVPISVLNTPSYIGEKVTGKKFPQLPYSDLNKAFRPEKSNALAGKIGSGIGNFTGSVASGLGLGGLFGAAQNVLNPRNISIFENALRGAGAGYAMAGEGNNRELGAGLGAALPFAVRAIEPVLPYIDAFLPGGLARNAARSYGNRSREFNQEYNQMTNEFERSGANRNFREPMIYEDAAEIYPRMNVNNREHFRDFLMDPNLEGAHRSKSEILGLMRSLEKKATKNGGSWLSRDSNTYEAAQRSINDIENSMNRAFNASNNPGLAGEYADLSRRYATQMGPYRDLPVFAEHAVGRAKNSTLTKKMLGNDTFMLSPEANNIPGLKTRELFDKLPFGKLGRGY